jgi:hypothetical protein
MSRNRGTPKPKLRDLGYLKLTREEEQALADAAVHANPTVTAIMGAVLVEHELEGFLRKRLSKRDDETWSDLTLDNGPLGTFHKKIIAAYALGIYGDVTRQNLNIVRNIRNAFAHSKKLIDFDHPLIVAELDKIAFRNERARKAFRQSKPANQRCYQNLCFMIACELMGKHIAADQSKIKRLDKKTAALRAKAFPYANALMQFIQCERLAGPAFRWRQRSHEGPVSGTRALS